MKKLFFLLFFLLNCFSWVSAENDFINDYTLIDCVDWNNDTWIVFDSNNSFATLKVWIESTIDYINSNINISWNEETSSWVIFNIKVNCSFNDIYNSNIDLKFNWVDFNNELIIEWVWDNSLIFKNVSFKLWKEAGNIIFKNAQFFNETNPYFYDFIPNPAWNFQPHNHPLSNWIKIIDSYISLKNWNNIWDNTNYKSHYYKYYNRYYYDDLYNYSNKHFIENSILDIEIENNFSFRLAVWISDSKINFLNKNFTWAYDINFLEDGNTNISSDLNFSILKSNEFDFWWNNFKSENTNNISFFNNSFKNFSSFDFWWSWIFINNFVENNSSIDISNFHNLYNNIFKSAFNDSYDIFNYRKNFSLNNSESRWLWWIYKRIRNNKYFNFDINSSELYKEITWKDLVKWLWNIYVIFNY